MADSKAPDVTFNGSPSEAYQKILATLQEDVASRVGKDETMHDTQTRSTAYSWHVDRDGSLNFYSSASECEKGETRSYVVRRAQSDGAGEDSPELMVESFADSMGGDNNDAALRTETPRAPSGNNNDDDARGRSAADAADGVGDV